MPAAEKVFELIANHTTDLVCLHDAENTIRYATPSSRSVLGYEPERLIGRKLTDYLTEAFINEMDFTTLMRFFDQPGARIRYQVEHGDNRLRWLETTFTKIQSEDLGEYHFLSTTRDITESVHLTDDLMQALSTEQELSKLKTNLYSVASHEFKTPLAVIQANIEMIRVKQSPKMIEAALDTMEEEVDQLNMMIGDMLELKKLTAGRRNFNAQKLDLTKIAAELQKALNAKRQKAVEIKLQEFGQPQEIKADYSLIRYIISNLLTNAQKFSPENADIDLNLHYGAEEVKIEVVDRGIGIPEDEQGSIFQSFYRAKNVGNVSGTGVGLSIAAEFVKLHRGKIDVDSKPGEGSTFIVTIPK